MFSGIGEVKFARYPENHESTPINTKQGFNLGNAGNYQRRNEQVAPEERRMSWACDQE
jgi:hypothetical protein